MPMNVSVARIARPRPARRSPARAVRCSGRCVVEPCESRILFHLEVQSQIPDQVVSIGTPSTTISLTNRIFNEVGPTVRFAVRARGKDGHESERSNDREIRYADVAPLLFR